MYIILGGMSVAFAHTPTDPAQLGLYPPTFPVELALGVASPRRVCEAFNISREEFQRLLSYPVFQEDLRRARDAVRREGASFRVKAQLQAEELLKTAWSMIHDREGVPATVRADLLKFVVRCSGLDASKDEVRAPGPSLNIQINL